MKTLLFSLTAAVTVITAAAPASAAPFALSAQAQQDVKQLISDLESIGAHASVDPDDVENLEDDLSLLISAGAKPSLETVRQLGIDAAAAFADGKLSGAEQLALLNDLKAVLSSASLTDDDIKNVQDDIIKIVASSSITSADLALILTDVQALLADLQGTFVVTTETIELSAPAGGRALAKESAGRDQAVIISALRAAIGAQASVGINTSSLQPGAYTVSVTSAATRAETPLGALQVVGAAGQQGTGAASFGPGGQPLPSGFNASDIATINIKSANGQSVLSGNAADAKATRAANFPLAGGPGAPSVKGNVSFQTRQKPSGPKSSFLLSASKLPPKTRLALKINGVDSGRVKTDAKGKLVIFKGNVAVPANVKATKLSPDVDVSRAQSIELETLDGQVAATAGFAQ